MHRPAIGRITRLEEPKARESLLTPAMRHSPSKASLAGSVGSAESAPPPPPAADAGKAPPPAPAEFSPMPLVQAANAALMERTPFAIDDAREGDDADGDELSEGGDDDQVLDEVRAARAPLRG